MEVAAPTFVFFVLTELECDGDLKLESEVELIGVDVKFEYWEYNEGELVLGLPAISFRFAISIEADVGVNTREPGKWNIRQYINCPLFHVILKNFSI